MWALKTLTQCSRAAMFPWTRAWRRTAFCAHAAGPGQHYRRGFRSYASLVLLFYFLRRRLIINQLFHSLLPATGVLALAAPCIEFMLLSDLCRILQVIAVDSALMSCHGPCRLNGRLHGGWVCTHWSFPGYYCCFSPILSRCFDGIKLYS